MHESPQAGESITHEGLATLRAELAELEGPARRAMAARIKAARELGDLKENAEYHIAKDDQAHLETRIKRLRARLQMAEVVEVDESSESFAFGQTAEVIDDASGNLHTWTLVGPTEADLGAGRLSVESPVGRALRDRDVGESVVVETPRGDRVYRIRAVVPKQRP
jgi:transcription elongation factor GreA